MLERSERSDPLIGPDLLRGARAILNWSLMEAGRRAGVSISIVVSAEGKGVRSDPALPTDVDKLRHAYEEGGVRFVDDAAAGLGLHIEKR